MNTWRILIVGLEFVLIGLDLRLIVFSLGKRHYGAVLAEVSYGMFVFYAAWTHGHSLGYGVTFGLIFSAIAAVIGIAGLSGIVRKLLLHGVYADGRSIDSERVSV